MQPEEYLEEVRKKLDTEGTVTIPVKVIPHARRTQLVGIDEEGVLKIKVTAPAEKGKANRAVIELIAGLFSVSLSHVTVLRGFEVRNKLIQISK